MLSRFRRKIIRFLCVQNKVDELCAAGLTSARRAVRGDQYFGKSLQSLKVCRREKCRLVILQKMRSGRGIRSARVLVILSRLAPGREKLRTGRQSSGAECQIQQAAAG